MFSYFFSISWVFWLILLYKDEKSKTSFFSSSVLFSFPVFSFIYGVFKLNLVYYAEVIG